MENCCLKIALEFFIDTVISGSGAVPAVFADTSSSGGVR
jgi:hypothetical protein